MIKFPSLMALLLSVQCGSMKAAGDALSEQELLLDLVLYHAPSLLLNHVSVCALASVSKKIKNRVTATQNIRRVALEDAIVNERYSIFQDSNYDPIEKKYDLNRRALYFYAQSSLAVALVTKVSMLAEFYGCYDFYCVYAYASDGDIKIVAPSNKIMLASEDGGITMGCYRGIPYLQMGFSDMGQVIDGPLLSLGEKHRYISLIHRKNPCDKDGVQHEYADEQQVETHGVFAGVVLTFHRESGAPISNVEKYLEGRRRPQPKQ
jgi:hypothetical protein